MKHLRPKVSKGRAESPLVGRWGKAPYPEMLRYLFLEMFGLILTVPALCQSPRHAESLLMRQSLAQFSAHQKKRPAFVGLNALDPEQKAIPQGGEQPFPQMEKTAIPDFAVLVSCATLYSCTIIFLSFSKSSASGWDSARSKFSMSASRFFIGSGCSFIFT